jgi:hypothetical protein
MGTEGGRVLLRLMLLGRKADNSSTVDVEDGLIPQFSVHPKGIVLNSLSTNATSR